MYNGSIGTQYLRNHQIFAVDPIAQAFVKFLLHTVFISVAIRSSHVHRWDKPRS
jgi:hypothetical protein